MARGAGKRRSLRILTGAELRARARNVGAETFYADAQGVRRDADESSLRAVVQALEADALRAATRPVPHTVVAWEGRLEISVRGVGRGPVTAHLVCEDGSELDRATRSRRDSLVRFTFEHLPLGVHELTVRCARIGDQGVRAHVISAPARAPALHAPRLGLFAPTYALRSARDWGAGDLTDLSNLAAWAGARGVGVLGTLPLFSTMLPLSEGAPTEPGPYAPVSRRFFSELYLDPERIPEWNPAGAAASQQVRSEIEHLRAQTIIDYPRVYRAKAHVLLAMADHARASGDRAAAIDRWSNQTPRAGDYAAFRASLETDDPAHRERLAFFHLYCQHALESQLRDLGAAMHEAGVMPYLDLPVGVHAAGLDAQSPEFAHGFSVGAPPDLFFARGQNWGFPPPHPFRASSTAHAEFRAALRAALSVSRAAGGGRELAGLLRVDHAAGLRRLFWIPRGADPADGVYVRSPHEELFACICLEAHRAGAAVVGEDLGTVPDQVRDQMRERTILGMYVVQFLCQPESPLPDPGPEQLACVNTHDTPTFAAFWSAGDVDLRRRVGLIDDTAAAAERRTRGQERRAALTRLSDAGVLPPQAADSAVPAAPVRDAIHSILARSPSPVAMVNLEDLWLEETPQNLPGFGSSPPPGMTEPLNWQHRLARTLEQIASDAALGAEIERLAALRPDTVAQPLPPTRAESAPSTGS